MPSSVSSSTSESFQPYFCSRAFPRQPCRTARDLPVHRARSEGKGHPVALRRVDARRGAPRLSSRKCGAHQHKQDEHVEKLCDQERDAPEEEAQSARDSGAESGSSQGLGTCTSDMAAQTEPDRKRFAQHAQHRSRKPAGACIAVATNQKKDDRGHNRSERNGAVHLRDIQVGDRTGNAGTGTEIREGDRDRQRTGKPPADVQHSPDDNAWTRRSVCRWRRPPRPHCRVPPDDVLGEHPTSAGVETHIGATTHPAHNGSSDRTDGEGIPPTSTGAGKYICDCQRFNGDIKPPREEIQRNFTTCVIYSARSSGQSKHAAGPPVRRRCRPSERLS